MRVLVASASKHGSTSEIARTIGASLSFRKIDVDVALVNKVTSIDEYDAVVLGSAIYMGHWLEPAKRFIAAHAVELSTRPVWLFSSGPLGDPPKPVEEPVDIAALMEATHAREHRRFPGSLWKEQLGIAERAMVAAVRAPEGDFRPWSEIDDWAGSIASALAVPA
jgi:menaquinone-dependent protoporphyrinogen oxidase